MELGNGQGGADSSMERALRSKIMDLCGAGSPCSPIPETSEHKNDLCHPKTKPDT